MLPRKWQAGRAGRREEIPRLFVQTPLEDSKSIERFVEGCYALAGPQSSFFPRDAQRVIVSANLASTTALPLGVLKTFSQLEVSTRSS